VYGSAPVSVEALTTVPVALEGHNSQLRVTKRHADRLASTAEVPQLPDTSAAAP
jgi:hypothetical protein